MSKEICQTLMGVTEFQNHSFPNTSIPSLSVETKSSVLCTVVEVFGKVDYKIHKNPGHWRLWNVRFGPRGNG